MASRSGPVCLLATITAQGKSTPRHRRPHTPTRLDSKAWPQTHTKSGQTCKCAMTQAAPSCHPRRSRSAGFSSTNTPTCRSNVCSTVKEQITPDTWFHTTAIKVMGSMRAVKPTLALMQRRWAPHMCHCSHGGAKSAVNPDQCGVWNTWLLGIW